MDDSFKNISYVCSLGTLCLSSMLIKNNGLKKCSYPFDWIFTDPDIIIKCLEDDFKDFLDKSHYMDKGPWQCGHKLYHPRMFNHKNPLTNENDYNYYVRCVNRFRQLQLQQEHKLFVMVFMNKEQTDENHKQTIIDFNQKLLNYVKNYTLLVIYHIKEQRKQNHIFTKVDNIDFIELHALSAGDGVNFTDDRDNQYLNKIIKSTYTFKLK